MWNDKYAEHPAITRRRECGDPEPQTVRCPVCGEECDTYYLGEDGVAGCEQCVTAVDAYDYAATH